VQEERTRQHQRLDSTASFNKSKSTSKSARVAVNVARSLNTTAPLGSTLKKSRKPSLASKPFSPGHIHSTVENRFKTTSKERKPHRVF